jgi:hypothetical protein
MRTPAPGTTGVPLAWGAGGAAMTVPANIAPATTTTATVLANLVKRFM